MDIIIVSTTSADLEDFWQQRLESAAGVIVKESTKVLVVFEDWPGGAGNGLGTLYAVQKAANKAKNLGYDLFGTFAPFILATPASISSFFPS